MSEPANAEANAIPITTSVRESYPLIIGKLNDYQQQINEAIESYQRQIDEIELMPGPSAYDSAVAGGFTGTEAEWVASLEGDPGPQGEQGPPGEDGTGFTQAQAEKLAALGQSASLDRDTALSIPNSSWTPVSWDGLISDPGNWRSADTSRVYPGAGVYLVTLYSLWAANGIGVRQHRVNSVVEGVSGAQINFTDSAKRTNALNAFSVQCQLVGPEDYISVDVWQDSGGALSYRETSALTVTRIG